MSLEIYNSLQTGDQNTSVSVAVPAVVGNTLTAHAVVVGGSGLDADESNFTLPSGWVLEGVDVRTSTALLFNFTKIADGSDDFSLSFPAAGRVFAFVLEGSGVTGTDIVSVDRSGTSHFFEFNPLPADGLSLVAVVGMNSIANYNYTSSSSGFERYGNTTYQAGTDLNDPRLHIVSRPGIAGEEPTGNVFFTESMAHYGIEIHLSGGTLSAEYPEVLSVSATSFVQGEQVVVTFDADLPVGLEVVNQSFGDGSLAFTLPSTDSVSFAVSDNAMPGDDVIISFRDGGVEFDSVTLPFSLASEWVGSVEVAAAIDEIDDEIAAGDIIAWDNADFDLDAAGPNFFWVGTGDPAATETLDYFTIDASDNAAFAERATITFDRVDIVTPTPTTPTPTTPTPTPAVNPVFDITVSVEGVLAPNTDVRVYAVESTDLTTIVLEPATYTTDASGAIRIDDDALDLSTAYNIYFRLLSEPDWGVHLYNQTPTDANA